MIFKVKTFDSSQEIPQIVKNELFSRLANTSYIIDQDCKVFFEQVGLFIAIQ